MKMPKTSVCAMLLLAACGSQEAKKDAKPAGPDYSKMTSIVQVEGVVPADLKIAYQNLFSCRYETAIKSGKPAPELGPKYAIDVLETVKKDAAAGDKCLTAMRAAHPEKAD